MKIASIAWLFGVAAQTGSPPSGGGVTLLDAVKQSLAGNPTIQIERTNVNSSRGSLGIAKGPFDWIVDSGISHQVLHTPFTPEIERIDDTTQLRLGLTKTFGWGTVVMPSVALQRTDSIIPAVVTGTVAAQNIAVVGLQIVQPLLRGFGPLASAQEDAAELFVKASLHDLQHAISERIFAAVVAYWEYLQAAKGLEVLQAGEARAQQILRDAKALVDADERPKADLEQLEANLADRARAKLEGEQALFDAKTALGIEMGLAYEAIATLPLPSIPLSEIAAADLNAVASKMVQIALERRQDLLGAKLRISGAQTLLSAAEDRQLPQLDLAGSLGYSGVVGGSGIKEFLEPLGKNVPGPNGQISLSLTWPVTGVGADGEVLQAQASLRRTELSRDDLARRVGASVSASLEQLKTSIRSVERAKKAAVHYRAAVENERTKLKSGLSTIIDVVLTEDLMTSALLTEISTQARYAQSVVRLNFEVGTLTTPDGETATIDPARLVTSPPTQ